MRYFFLFIIFTLISCESSEQENSLDYTIEYGVQGSLCGIYQSVLLKDRSVKYTNRILCNSIDETVTRALTDAKFEAVLSTFNVDTIKSLDWNSCARCVDGIDSFLTINNEEETRSLFFGDSTNTSELGDFLEILNNILNSFEK